MNNIQDLALNEIDLVDGGALPFLVAAWAVTEGFALGAATYLVLKQIAE